jgi:hypothetical protein
LTQLLVPYHHRLAFADLWSLSEAFRGSSLFHCSALLFSTPTPYCFAFKSLFLKNLLALIGTLLLSFHPSALLLRFSTLLLYAGAFLCLELMLLHSRPLLSCPRSLLGYSRLFLDLPLLLCGSRSLFLRLTPLLCCALLGLALLLGCPCGVLLSLPLLLRSSCRRSRLFLRVSLLLRSCPGGLLLCRTRSLLLLRRGSGGLLLCGTSSLLLLHGGPRAVLCLSLVNRRLHKLHLFSTWGARDES